MCNVPCACCTLTERRRRNQFNAGKRVQPLQGDCDFLRTLSIIAEAAHDIKRSKTRAKAGGTAVAVAVPFQEVISERGREATAADAEEAEGRPAAPISPPKEIRSVRRSIGPPVYLAFDQKFLVYFRICLPHGKSWPDREEDWMSLLRSILGVRGKEMRRCRGRRSWIGK